MKFNNLSCRAKSKMLLSALLLSIGLVGCGGGGGGGDDRVDYIQLDMKPLRAVTFNDDSGFVAYPLYPISRLITLDDIVGDSILIRILDPYNAGDFYSIQVSNSYGGGADPAMPMADDGEPDNMPLEASPIPEHSYLHRGLNPAGDEDWFLFTFGAIDFTYVSTKPNGSGSIADPVLEVYDATVNPGSRRFAEVEIAGGDRIVAGVYDPSNELTMITMGRITDPGVGLADFTFVFEGLPQPGNRQIRFAFPPLPADAPGSVSGWVNIDAYGSTGSDIAGTFDITITDISRTTTASGSFQVTRESDEPGLLNGLKPGDDQSSSPRDLPVIKRVPTYITRLSN